MIILNRDVLVDYLLIGIVLFSALCSVALAESPIDDEIFVSDEDAEWSVDEPQGPAREQHIDATEGTWQTVSVCPDGTEVVFDFLGDLYVMPIEGADGKGDRFPEKLTSGMSWDMQPEFSHDGQSIAFVSDRNGKSKKAGWNIWIIDRETKEVQQVTNESYRLLHSPTWSPDDQYIVARKHFTSRRSMGAGELWMYHRDGLRVDAADGLQLTKRKNDQKDLNEPVFSPDGKFIYFSQDVTPGDIFEYDKDSNKGIYAIKRMELETGEIETVISGPGGACCPVPSPDGKTIAFVRRVGAKTGLHLFDVESGAVRLIYSSLERDMQETWAVQGVYPDFAWTPDGREIVFWAQGKIRRLSVTDGREQVIPFHIQDTRQIVERIRFPVEVAPNEFDVKILRWVVTSPAESQVVYQALGYLYVKDLPDGVPRRLTDQTDHFEFCPSYSRDGKQIVYTTWNDETLGAIRLFDLESGRSHKITTKSGHYIDPVFSPDGQTIVFCKVGGGYLRSPLYSHDQGIYRIPTVGGVAVRLSEDGQKPQFAESSERLFLTKAESEKDADNLTLFSVDLSGNERQVHFRSKWGTDCRISPDGKWVAFIERFNVYLVPFVRTGQTINIGPGNTSFPLRRLSENAGEWIHFSGDSQRLHWTLGPELYTTDVRLDIAIEAEKPVEDILVVEEPVVLQQHIGFPHPHDQPSSHFALRGARIVTMGERGVIENGVVVVNGNRITAVGDVTEVKIPDGVEMIDISGQTVLPGFIDVHAHGPQATQGISPQKNWLDYARLAFGVTTVHDPSNDTNSIFAASELTKAGLITSPRTFSTGKILYGASGAFKAEVDSLEDARFHLNRMKAVGAFSVKSYNQPRRDQRQMIVEAARELKMMVVPEGGATFMNNMTMIVDGHTGIEHTLPVQAAYDDVMDLWRGTEVGYTPTLCVAYGGISGEQYWYQVDDLWLHPRLQSFIPPQVLNPRSRRRNKAPLEDYNHIKVAQIARQVVDQGGLAQVGGHGQLNGICSHWEMWSFVQGGMSPLQALECGTINGAKYLGLDRDLGSIEVGKLADLIVFEEEADPLTEIRDSEKIELTIANGRIFNSKTMTLLGDEETAPIFYWGSGDIGTSITVPGIPGCSCFRPGCLDYWQRANQN